MKTEIVKTKLTFLLLAFFVTTKMAGLHALTHSIDKDHIEQCSVCEYVITQNLIPVIPAGESTFTWVINDYFNPRDQFVSHEFTFTGSYATDQLFSRPPPRLV